MIRWTPEARALVLRLWDTHLSGSKIAERVGAEHGLIVTKSAVIGVAFRAEKSFSGPRTTESRSKSRRNPTEESRLRDRDRKAAKKTGLTRVAKPAPAPKPRPEPARPAGVPTSLRIPLVKIRDGECKYIADDPRMSPATCCRHATAEGSPWCPGHYAVCTVPIRRAVSVWMPEHRRAA